MRFQDNLFMLKKMLLPFGDHDLVVHNLANNCFVVVRVEVHGLVKSRRHLHHHPLGQESAYLSVQEEVCAPLAQGLMVEAEAALNNAMDIDSNNYT